MTNKMSLLGKCGAVVATLLLGSGLCVATAGNVVVVVSVEPGSPQSGQLEAIVRDSLTGSPFRILATKAGRMTIETDSGGYDALASEALLTDVELVSAATEATAVPSSTAIEWTVQLVMTGPGLAEGIDLAAAGKAKVAARVVSRKRVSNRDVQSPDLGHGLLLVRGLDKSGAEISRSVVADPRLVRFEDVDAAGEFIGRREFLRRHATLSVTLADDPAVATIAVDMPVAGGLQSVTRVTVR